MRRTPACRWARRVWPACGSCFAATAQTHGTGSESMSLGVGCGGEKASPESNSTAFLQWLDNACAAWGVTSAWRCLRNNELPGLAQSVLKQVKLAAPKHLSAQALAETLAALKVQETDGFAIEQLCEKQRAYFDQGKTLSLDFRFHRLEAVKRWMDTHARRPFRRRCLPIWARAPSRPMKRRSCWCGRSSIICARTCPRWRRQHGITRRSPNGPPVASPCRSPMVRC